MRKVIISTINSIYDVSKFCPECGFAISIREFKLCPLCARKGKQSELRPVRTDYDVQEPRR